MSALSQSLSAWSAETNKAVLFAAAFAGVIAHWLYELAVDVIRTGTWTAPTMIVVVARVFVSFIAAAAGFVAIYKQAESASAGFKILTAFTLGLAIDALTSPWAQPTTP